MVPPNRGFLSLKKHEFEFNPPKKKKNEEQLKMTFIQTKKRIKEFVPRHVLSVALFCSFNFKHVHTYIACWTNNVFISKPYIHLYIYTHIHMYVIYMH